MIDIPADVREMHKEIAALVAALAKAFSLGDAEVIRGLEADAFALDFREDANGNRFVLARYGDKSARIYPGAIKQEPQV